MIAQGDQVKIIEDEQNPRSNSAQYIADEKQPGIALESSELLNILIEQAHYRFVRILRSPAACLSPHLQVGQLHLEGLVG